MSTLFNWYEKAIAEKKHAYVGYNASLDDLEQYFARDGAVGLDRVLRIMDNKIAHADYPPGATETGLWLQKV